MNYIGKLVNNVRHFYNEINSSTLSGALDIVVVEQPDGVFKSSPFYVKFGKLGVLRSKEKMVDVTVNGNVINAIIMKLSQNGDAYFVSQDYCDCFNCMRRRSNVDVNLLSSDGVLSDDPDLSMMSEKNRMLSSVHALSDGEDMFSLSKPQLKPIINVNPQLSANKSTECLPIISESSSVNENPLSSTIIAENLAPFNESTLIDAIISPVENGTDKTNNSHLPIQSDNTINVVNNSILLSICGGYKSPKHMPMKFDEFIVSYQKFIQNPLEIINNKNLIVKIDKRYYPFTIAASILLCHFVYGQEMSKKNINELILKNMPNQQRSSWFTWRKNEKINYLNDTSDEEIIKPVNPSIEIQQQDENKTTSNQMNNPKTIPSNDDNFLVIDPQINDSMKNIINNYDLKNINKMKNLQESIDRFDESIQQCRRRFIVPNDEMLRSLNLSYGFNEITYSVTTRLQGTVTSSACIYLVKHDDKFIISDIDGTITKSDVLGHMLPLVGKDWVHNGIVDLYNKITKNGYHVIYLSSRSIGLATRTRDFLSNIYQRDRALPVGPILLSPTSLLKGIYREVIEKKPELFKTACLKDIKSLFPTNYQPFYSGFGNLINDAIAYKAIGINKSRIFIINHKGEINCPGQGSYKQTYSSMSDIVDHIFPPYDKTLILKSLNNEINIYNNDYSHLPNISDYNSDDVFPPISFWKPSFDAYKIDVVVLKKSVK